MNIAKIGMKILDVGCGSGNLYEVFYRNRYSPKIYLGVDVRSKTIEANIKKFPKAYFMALDVVTQDLPRENWDIITCFEVLEHVGKQNVIKVLNNIRKVANKDMVILISTPNYDEKVGAAENHIIDGEVCEMTKDELCEKITQAGFKIVRMFGTFASQRDIKPLIQRDKKLWEIYQKLHDYYDSNLISVIFAPLFPAYSRNILYELKVA